MNEYFVIRGPLGYYNPTVDSWATSRVMGTRLLTYRRAATVLLEANLEGVRIVGVHARSK